MAILLMCEHLYGCICKTVWSADESWEEYVERVRVYDPTAASFKRIHYALLFGHGLPTTNAFGDDSSRYRMRPSPSQQNIVHGQAVRERRGVLLRRRSRHVLEARVQAEDQEDVWILIGRIVNFSS